MSVLRQSEVEGEVYNQIVFKKIIFFLLIFCLPFQFGYHFWLPQSFVSSFRIDYLSPTLYLTDLLILCYLVLNPRHIKINPLLLALAIFNLLITKGNPTTLFAWFRLFEYYFLFQVLRSEPDLISKVRKPFLISLGLIFTLALLQFVRQSSLGGPFYYLGERPLSVFLPNIAKIDIQYQISNIKSQILFLRPYSTFGHPNSLAGYLLVSLIFLPLFTRSKLLKIFTLATLILTFSKSAILALILIEVFRPSIFSSLILSFFIGLAPLLKYTNTIPQWLQQSFVTRHYLIPPSLEIIKEHWLAGVGLRQFIPSLAQQLPGNQLSYQSLQPVHNTPLLIIAELGVIGVTTLYKLLSETINPLLRNPNAKKYLSKILGVVFITGALDHYWWTLPQNQLIIILALALISNSSLSSLKLGEEAPLSRRGEVKTAKQNHL